MGVLTYAGEKIFVREDRSRSKVGQFSRLLVACWESSIFLLVDIAHGGVAEVMNYRIRVIVIIKVYVSPFCRLSYRGERSANVARGVSYYQQ